MGVARRVIKKVMKAKAVSKASTLASKFQGQHHKKVRIGIVLGQRGNDPCVVGSKPRDLPKNMLMKGEGGWGGDFHIDAGVAWHIHKNYPEVIVDPIPFKEVSQQRLRKNDINILMGGDYIDATFNGGSKSAFAKNFLKTMKDDTCNVFPNYRMQDWIYYKHKYMKQFMKAGVPMLPTIFLSGNIDHLKLLQEIKARKWTRFVIKPELSCFSIGFMAAYTADVEKDPNILKKHFAESKAPGYLVQEFLESKEFPGQSFTEIRCQWINGEFSHAAETTAESEEKGIEGIVIPPPKNLLEEAVEVGKKAMKEILKVSTFKNKQTPPPLIRMDIGICQFPIKGLKQTGSTTLFVNEIEPLNCNYLTRYFANDSKGFVGKFKGQRFKNYKGFSMRDRLAEYFVKKANELCGEGTPVKLSWTPGTFGGVRTGKLHEIGKVKRKVIKSMKKRV